MPQDRESGARASEYGLNCGKRIIEAIGATSTKPGSNECFLDGELISVHCARRSNNRIGVTYKALDTVAAVFGAFEQEDGSYLVWRMSKSKFEELMTGTRSQGSSKGKVGIVSQIDFEGMARDSRSCLHSLFANDSEKARRQQNCPTRLS
jgi:hypothetical protein